MKLTPVQNYIVLGVCALLGVGIWFWTRDWSVTPEALARKALTASDVSQRANAALELSMLKGSNTLVQLRRVAAESKDADVLLNVIIALGRQSDGTSVPLYITMLDNPDNRVRAASYNCLLKLLPSIFPDDLEYHPTTSSADERKAVRRLEAVYQKMLTDRPPAGKVVAPK